MKKKKLTGKLSLEKSKISALNASRIVGGGSHACGLSQGVPGQVTGCITADTCSLSCDTGSECKCL